MSRACDRLEASGHGIHSLTDSLGCSFGRQWSDSFYAFFLQEWSIPSGIKYMQSGEITFGVKYLPDEPASTDAVSLTCISCYRDHIVSKIESRYLYIRVQ
jgi:hypothetical protein